MAAGGKRPVQHEDGPEGPPPNLLLHRVRGGRFRRRRRAVVELAPLERKRVVDLGLWRVRSRSGGVIRIDPRQAERTGHPDGEAQPHVGLGSPRLAPLVDAQHHESLHLVQGGDQQAVLVVILEAVLEGGGVELGNRRRSGEGGGVVIDERPNVATSQRKQAQQEPRRVRLLRRRRVAR